MKYLKRKRFASDDFIVGYRLSPEEAESPGITMDITKELVNAITKRYRLYSCINYGYLF